MKLRKILYVVSGALLIVGASACTDLTEKVYDKIVSDNYYQNKQDVVRAFYVLSSMDIGQFFLLTVYKK